MIPIQTFREDFRGFFSVVTAVGIAVISKVLILHVKMPYLLNIASSLNDTYPENLVSLIFIPTSKAHTLLARDNNVSAKIALFARIGGEGIPRVKYDSLLAKKCPYATVRVFVEGAASNYVKIQCFISGVRAFLKRRAFLFEMTNETVSLSRVSTWKRYDDLEYEKLKTTVGKIFMLRVPSLLLDRI